MINKNTPKTKTKNIMEGKMQNKKIEGNETIQDYRLTLLEKQIAENQKIINENQKQLITKLERIETQFQKDHERIIQHEAHLQQLDTKLEKYDKYLFMIISTVIAQIFVLITQLIPHIFH
ncbi:MAG: hypothetical protein BZ134_00215 [Methanosphaera sp. SHI1033]|nr:MAG: hypothetical protein BZ134_00215 [Methanosphaera sp. SHI1033]